MRSTIYFNGKSSADFGLIVEYYPESVHAARRGELIPIPGRNGVIIREDGAYDTYQQTYQIWFRNTLNRDTFQTARDVAEWLLAASGFCRLEDTYEPEHFRLARFVGPLNIETVLRDHGRATLEFDVQPQRYLKSGETPIRFKQETSDPFVINNPTQFEARPLLKFTDTSGDPPAPVAQTLTNVDDTFITESGSVGKIAWSSGEGKEYTTQATSTSGYDYAIITAKAYTFLASNGKSVGFDFGNFKNKKVIIPTNAVSVVLGNDIGKSSALSLQVAPPNPGNAAATINGTTINLDFSAHDIIYLDCDLHDAYYIDGSNANNAVSFSSNVDDYPTFPGLIPGENVVIPGDGTILDFEIVPRWWTL